MALTLGTNCGFVTEAPTANPSGAVALTQDTRATAVKHTCPADVNTITEIGWWCDNATEEANFEVGIYSDAAANEPELLQDGASQTNAKGTASGWKVVTGLSIPVTPDTVYWIAVQLDDTATATNIDAASSGGSGNASKNTQTTLPADWGTSSAADNDAMYAIYALVEQVDEGGGEEGSTGGESIRKYGGAVADAADRLDRAATDFVRKYA